MKKNLLLLGTMGLIASAALFLNGCKKDDTDAPLVTVNGGSSMTISLNSTFTDPGATANDEEDGVIAPVNVSGTVDKDTKGDYTLTYTATDAAGNQGSATLTVHVVNDAESWAGTYSVVDTIMGGSVFNPATDTVITYSQVISTDSHVNNRIHFDNFGKYSNNTTIYAGVTGNAITLTSQQATNIGSFNDTHTFAGTGTRTGSNFVLTYTDQNNSNGNATVNRIAHFTK